MKHYILLAIVLLVGLSACEKDSNDPVDNSMVLIAEGSTDLNLFEVKLMAEDTLFEGYNDIYLQISNAAGEKLRNATISLLPMMNMTTMKHAAPIENPNTETNSDNLFEGAIVFIMPSNPDEGWTLDVAVDSDGFQDTITLNIPVVKSLAEAKLLRVTSAIDDTRYFVSLLQPVKPIVGVNDMELTIHYKKTMMDFPVTDDLTIVIEPEMPSMGHGSPNNVNPVTVGNGHYLGKVNFTMTGWWRVNVTIYKGQEVVAENIYFDITF